MRMLIAVVGLLLFFSVTAAAQPAAGPNSRAEWDMNETDAQTLEYWMSVDGNAATQVQNVSCAAGPAPEHVCVGDLPAMVPGNHRLTVFARRVANGTNFDSLPSTPLDITFMALPSSPQGLRLRNDS